MRALGFARVRHSSVDPQMKGSIESGKKEKLLLKIKELGTRGQDDKRSRMRNMLLTRNKCVISKSNVS